MYSVTLIHMFTFVHTLTWIPQLTWINIFFFSLRMDWKSLCTFFFQLSWLLQLLSSSSLCLRQKTKHLMKLLTPFPLVEELKGKKKHMVLTAMKKVNQWTLAKYDQPNLEIITTEIVSSLGDCLSNLSFSLMHYICAVFALYSCYDNWRKWHFKLCRHSILKVLSFWIDLQYTLKMSYRNFSSIFANIIMMQILIFKNLALMWYLSNFANPFILLSCIEKKMIG